jgi:two-component system, chemotaxis family, sensor kinase CheA
LRPIDRSLIEIFSSEQAEHLGRIRGLLEVLANSSADVDSSALDELQRRAHTLKGAAHAVGLEPTEAIVHRLETVFAKVRWGDAAQATKARALIEHTLEAVEDILAAALAERDLPDVADLQRALEAFPSEQFPLDAPAPLQAVPTQPAISSSIGLPPSGESDLVRVSASRIDQLVQSSSELLIATGWKTDAESLFARHAQHLDELRKDWQQLRHGARSGLPGDDSGELQRADACLKYIDRELVSLRLQAHAAVAAWDLRTNEIRRRAQDLYDDACGVRMTPAETVFAGSGSLVRDLAHQENKRVEFRAEGLDTQADRMVLQALKDPVLHLLRNAVSHGAEPEAERAAAGKGPIASVRMRIYARGDRLNLTIEDDGRGINESAVIEEATRRGLIPGSSEAASQNVAKLLLLPGLSTARQITNLSGRGLGLAIVQEAVTRLQGDLSIRAAPAGGTMVSITVPLAMSTQRVLLVNAAEYCFAIATSFLERLLRVDLSAIHLIEGRESIIVDSEAIPLVRLVDLLNLPLKNAAREETRKLDVFVASANDVRFAVVVDALLDERDAIIKDIGLPGSKSGFAAGAIPLDDGAVAMVLNVPELFLHRDKRTLSKTFLIAEPKKKTVSILVVDDSLTTRSLERSILEAHGYKVRVAVDGLQALEQIHLEKPDLVISDVMMPRMTGFELLDQIKGDASIKDLPVILVTSLESPEEQGRGLELGADAYIVKNRFDQGELLRIVRQIV